MSLGHLTGGGVGFKAQRKQGSGAVAAPADDVVAPGDTATPGKTVTPGKTPTPEDTTGPPPTGGGGTSTVTKTTTNAGGYPKVTTPGKWEGPTATGSDGSVIPVAPGHKLGTSDVVTALKKNPVVQDPRLPIAAGGQAKPSAELQKTLDKARANENQSYIAKLLGTVKQKASGPSKETKKLMDKEREKSAVTIAGLPGFGQKKSTVTYKMNKPSTVSKVTSKPPAKGPSTATLKAMAARTAPKKKK